VKLTQDQQERMPRDQQGTLKNHLRFFPGSQLRGVFQSMNFITPSRKLLDVIQSYKYFIVEIQKLPPFGE
jgi:hypothetical protein